MQIAKAVDEETVTRDLVPAFVKLLKDTEAEVRTAIAGQIPGELSPPSPISSSLHLRDNLLTTSRLLWTFGSRNFTERDHDQYRGLSIRHFATCSCCSRHTDQWLSSDSWQRRVGTSRNSKSCTTNISLGPLRTYFPCFSKC